MRLRHQSLEIVDESFARVLGVLVVASDVDRFLRADLLTVTAEDAAELVDLEHQRIPIPVLIFAGNELDAVGGTHGRAETAGDALRLAILRRQHAMCASPPRRERPLLLGILNGDLLLKHVLQRQRHSLERRADVARLLDGALDYLHADCHYRTASARGSCAMRSAVTARSRSR